MHYYYIKKVEDFDIFLVYNQWPTLLKKVEKELLAPSKIASLYEKRGENYGAEVPRCLPIYKYEFKFDCINI